MHTRNQIFQSAPIKIVIACSILFMEVTPARADEQRAPLRAAFLGFHCDGVSPEIQNRIQIRVLGLLYQQRSIQVLSPSEVVQQLGPERINAVLAQQSTDSMRSIAVALNADYVFAGHLRNLGGDTVRTVLEGQIIRYDRKTNSVRYVNILRYYDEFELAAVDIQRDLIMTMQPVEETFVQKYLPLVVVGAIVVGGLIFLVTSKAGSSTPGNGPASLPTTN